MGKKVDIKTSRENAPEMIIVRPGEQPPCLKPGFGVCRGCFGWENMLEAVLSGDPVWSKALIHCSETGLTVTLKKQ